MILSIMQLRTTVFWFRKVMKKIAVDIMVQIASSDYRKLICFTVRILTISALYTGYYLRLKNFDFKLGHGY